MSAPPPPIEQTRLCLQAWLEWIMWRAPGEATSGKLVVGQFEEAKPSPATGGSLEGGEFEETKP